MGFFSNLTSKFSSVKQKLSLNIKSIFSGKIDRNSLEELETSLLKADCGIDFTEAVIDKLSTISTDSDYNEALKQILLRHLPPAFVETPHTGTKLVLVIGVNGVGKTTTIAKVAKHYQASGASMMLAAGDTFRAAAIEQLKVWSERLSIPVVAQQHGSDSAAVIYDALASARAKKYDYLFADTAGRLQNKTDLMRELEKITRVVKKLDATAPHEKMLILDATIGQNSIDQALTFHRELGLDSICITKLDGSAKAGAIFPIYKELQLPIKFIGLGEQLTDLKPFDPNEFVSSLFT